MIVYVIFCNGRWFISFNKIQDGVYFFEIYYIYEGLFDELDYVERIVRDNGEYFVSVIVVI